MTQLGELRDAYPKFQAAGVKLYAVSYDDREALAAFAEANRIPFPLLSDADSQVIRAYGLLNTQVRPDEVPFYGIPFPGTYVVDESGVVVEKFFPRHIANRESPESVLEGALGEIHTRAAPCGRRPPAASGSCRRRRGARGRVARESPRGPGPPDRPGPPERRRRRA